MATSDLIARFIQEALDAADGIAELQRSTLADRFHCVPSQINYVISTRFSPEYGYLVESRRGGGGYIRIVRVVESGSQRLMYLINERIGDSLGEEECMRLISQLKEQRIVTADEAALMASSISSRALAVPVPDALKNAMRAKMMKSMLMTIAARNRK